MSTKRNPFEILGLPARRDLTDEQVDAPGARSPSRPTRTGTAGTGAYTSLRRLAELPFWSCSEAYADLVEQAWAAGHDGLDDDGQPYTEPLPAVPLDFRDRPAPRRPDRASWLQLPSRIRRGRPLRLAAPRRSSPPCCPCWC